LSRPPAAPNERSFTHDRTAARSALRVLVVDDEVAIATLVADALEDEGYQVRMHHDGASALLDIVNDTPDLVLLDIAMPVMVGDELLRYLRAHGFPHLPVIVMTAGLHPEQYLEQGADAVLAKPFDLQKMLDTVQRYLPPQNEWALGA
jgi:CheY-like chemotaxis protein